LLAGRRIADLDLPAHAQIAELAVGDLRKRPRLGVELIQRIAQPRAAREFGAGVARSLSGTDLDMQEIEMRRQRARGRHSRLKDHLIAVPAAEKDEDGFHKRRTSAVRANRSCCEGNAAMAQILTVAEHLRKLTARSR